LRAPPSGVLRCAYPQWGGFTFAGLRKNRQGREAYARGTKKKNRKKLRGLCVYLVSFAANSSFGTASLDGKAELLTGFSRGLSKINRILEQSQI
jgi:hypothetical protein